MTKAKAKPWYSARRREQQVLALMEENCELTTLQMRDHIGLTVSGCKILAMRLVDAGILHYESRVSPKTGKQTFYFRRVGNPFPEREVKEEREVESSYREARNPVISLWRPTGYPLDRC